MQPKNRLRKWCFTFVSFIPTSMLLALEVCFLSLVLHVLPPVPVLGHLHHTQACLSDILEPPGKMTYVLLLHQLSLYSCLRLSAWSYFLLSWWASLWWLMQTHKETLQMSTLFPTHKGKFYPFRVQRNNISNTKQYPLYQTQGSRNIIFYIEAL